jgi:hyperosmotically inducible protein
MASAVRGYAIVAPRVPLKGMTRPHVIVLSHPTAQQNTTLAYQKKRQKKRKDEDIMHSGRIARTIQTLLLSGACSLIALPAMAQTAPDNTKVNKADRAKGAVTADQQKENPADRDLAKKIRAAIVADKNLSTYAHNVKVVVQGGQVTLKGPVRSEDEKKAIEDKATEIAGAGKVTDQITIAPGDAPKKPKG